MKNGLRLLKNFHVMKKNEHVEMPGIEPGAFHMQSERATTALHPRRRRGDRING